MAFYDAQCTHIAEVYLMYEKGQTCSEWIAAGGGEKLVCGKCVSPKMKTGGSPGSLIIAPIAHSLTPSPVGHSGSGSGC